MIAAGVNAKALCTYMGHANIATTMDRYGHLMPGNEAEAADLLDAYLVAHLFFRLSFSLFSFFLSLLSFFSPFSLSFPLSFLFSSPLSDVPHLTQTA